MTGWREPACGRAGCVTAAHPDPELDGLPVAPGDHGYCPAHIRAQRRTRQIIPTLTDPRAIAGRRVTRNPGGIR